MAGNRSCGVLSGWLQSQSLFKAFSERLTKQEPKKEPQLRTDLYTLNLKHRPNKLNHEGLGLVRV